MSVVIIGLSHHTAPVALRERFAFAEADIPGALKVLRDSGVAAEAVILSTCNRVEIYAATTQEPAAAFAALKDFLLRRGAEAQRAGSGDVRRWQPQSNAAPDSPRPEDGHHPESGGATAPGEGPEAVIYARAEPESLRHLFRVACGLDSLVPGETEILGQLKEAYELARKNHFTGARLNRIFQRAFHVAKHVRTHTNIQRGSVSVASVAVELAEKIFSSLTGREVLVVGAGDTGEKVARALRSRGAGRVVIASRTLERAEGLAGELGGRAVPFDHWAEELERMDIVISSTSAPHPILDRAGLAPVVERRRGRPLLLMDLAVPRDVDPEVNFLENVYLYNIDDLQTVADGYLKLRREEMARCEKIISENVEALFRQNAWAGLAAERGLNLSNLRKSAQTAD
jgi:glutamyl-tRNA reductase